MYSYLISLCCCQILYMIFAVKLLLFYHLGYTHMFNVSIIVLMFSNTSFT